MGPRGPLLIQDRALLEEIAHFDRERIPERVVHAKGAGAFGYFEVSFLPSLLTMFLVSIFFYINSPFSEIFILSHSPFKLHFNPKRRKPIWLNIL